MKTNNKYKIKNIVMLAVILFAASFSFAFSSEEDSLSYKTYSGKVIGESESPIVFATVYLKDLGLGTITNPDGEFVIKIPTKYKDEKLCVSFLGYEKYEIPVANMQQKDNVFRMKTSTIKLEEVIVRSKDPIDLLMGAQKRIPQNYQTNPVMLTGFYRETVQKNKNYVAISEAVVDIYKTSYGEDFPYDKIKIYKGRKSTDVKKMDTIAFKLQGGPSAIILLDIVKNPSALISESFFPYYDYTLDDVVSIDGRKTYVIAFKQKRKYDYPLYKGKIYLDMENLAITQIEFSLDEMSLDVAARILVKKSPVTMKVSPMGGNYLANYRQIDNKWYLNYMRGEVKFKCNWKRKLFNSVFTTMSEMAITDMSTDNVEKFKMRETAKLSDIFVDQVDYFADDNYWGKYNYIKPDESIEIAIAKLGKRLVNK